jgi:hypothetical protein
MLFSHNIEVKNGFLEAQNIPPQINNIALLCLFSDFDT